MKNLFKILSIFLALLTFIIFRNGLIGIKEGGSNISMLPIVPCILFTFIFLVFGFRKQSTPINKEGATGSTFSALTTGIIAAAIFGIAFIFIYGFWANLSI